MTPKIIGLKQAPVVLVELPVNFSEPTGISLGSFSDWSVQNLDTGEYYGLGQDLKTMGILSDLTEEQFAECVDTDDQYGVVMYRNYKTTSMPYYDEQINAKQSFLSLLESESVYTRNPLQEWYDNSNLLDEVSEKDMTLRYQEAQSRTIDPKRTVVLIKRV